MAATLGIPRPTPVAQDPEASPLSQFGFADFLKKEYRFGIPPERPYCKAFREGFCPLGKNCPDKHPVTHSSNILICKHWLKGLCKKGDQCDFLHEYNIRMRPECTHFTRGNCNSGEDCIYLHIDPKSKLPPCPHYEKGLCPLGPGCAKKHVRKTLCRFYLAGFCPYGRQCKEGAHPRFPENLPKPSVKVEPSAEEIELERERDRRRDENETLEQREWDAAARRDGRGRGGKGRWGQRRRGGFDR